MKSVVSLVAFITLALVSGASGGHASDNRENAPDAPKPVPGGIWKAAIPPHPMHGEFDNLDPMGLAAGARIRADCSLNWVSPDTGKLYCFASGTSIEFFLDSPTTNLHSAEAAWISMGHGTNTHGNAGTKAVKESGDR